MESELVLCMFLLSFGSICCTEYFDCGSKQVTIKDVAVQNCPGTGVCKLKKGTDASVDVTFIANQDINEVPVLLHGVMFNASLPYPGQYNKDGCIDSNLECPLQSGKEYTYKLSLPVYKKYPSFPDVKEVLLTVNNNDSDLHICGLLPVSTWRVYEVTTHPGALLVCNPFTEDGFRYWVCRCLSHYTQRSLSRRNLDIHGELGEEEDWWDVCNRDSSKKELLQRLRWATLGYHHNWDTKEYSEELKGPFPKDLAALSQHVVAGVFGLTDYDAQAAIVNFYPVGSTLSGHTDHSEKNMTAPLLSFSFGCSAVFLLGGHSLDEEPIPMLLQSGDILIMSGQSRLSYHGVPRVIPDSKRDYEISNSNTVVCNNCSDILDCSLMSQCKNELFWEPFSKYICLSRINMNIRQVLATGQTSLDKGLDVT